MRTREALCSASFLILALAAGPASAQTESDGGLVDELVVTAQRREQNLQDVPIVVTTLGAQILQDAGVRDIKDLTVLTPGLMVTSTANEGVTTARIRGVGTVGDNPGLESSVGVLIDGVYRPRNGVGFGDLGEMQRIEVLKGPQGTLFGKNTSSGVINILTEAPSFDLGARSELTAGNYGAFGFANSITRPLTDQLAGRLYLAARRRDGFQTVATGVGPRTRDDDADQNFATARGQLLWRPSGDVDVRLIADISRRDESCCVGGQIASGISAPLIQTLAARLGAGQGLLSPPAIDRRLTFANRPTDQDIDDKGVSAEVAWRMPGGATLTSITAVRAWRSTTTQDVDFTTLDLLYRTGDDFFRDFQQASQEVRLAGETGPAAWVVGAFASRERLKSGESMFQGRDLELYLSALLAAAATPGGAVAQNGLAAITGRPLGTNLGSGEVERDRYKQTSDSYALFGNVNWRATEALELTAGLRFTAEQKDLAAWQANLAGGRIGANFCTPAFVGRAAILGGAGGLPNTDVARAYAGYVCPPHLDPAYDSLTTRQSREENEFSGTAKAAWRFTPDAMAYFSYARGYKAGGFNLERVRLQTNPLNPSGLGTPNLDTSFPGEFVDSWEAGAKTSWLSGDLLLNATLFWQDFENFQLNAFDGVAFTVTSIPEVTSRGVDADMMWRTPVAGLSLQGGVTYAETQYARARPRGPNFALPTAASPSGGGLYRLPGARISFAPLWSGSASATYERPVAGLAFRSALSARYTSSYNTGSDLNPLKVQEPLTLLNARAGLGAEDERWAVELWAQNLTDETYVQVAFDGPFQPNQFNGFLGAPRTVGATLRLRY